MNQKKESDLSTHVQESYGVFVDLASDYLIKIAILEFPILGVPVIKQLFEFILKRILSKVKDEGQLLISFKITDEEIHQQKEQYDTAIAELKEVLKNSPTEEAKNEALKKAKDSLRNLIRFPR